MIGNLTNREKEIIKDNLRAFEMNFGTVRIVKTDYGKGYYVFFPSESDSWIQFCYDISYLDGWLYGVVQGIRRGEFRQYIENPVFEKGGINYDKERCN